MSEEDEVMNKEASTAIFYINQRIDKLEESLQNQINNRFDTLEKTIDAHLALCRNTTGKFDVRVRTLEGFKNRAIGVTALLIIILGLLRVT